jgi:hypothetical protein
LLNRLKGNLKKKRPDVKVYKNIDDDTGSVPYRNSFLVCLL